MEFIREQFSFGAHLRSGPLLPTSDLNRLLVIDDSADDHLLFCAILRRAGITNPVDWVSSGEDAMHYLDGCLAGLKPWPSVVFLDIRCR